jgi:hypothetical protein
MSVAVVAAMLLAAIAATSLLAGRRSARACSTLALD